MTDKLASGTLGKLIGKAKEAIGTAIAHDDLVQEGQLQQASVEGEELARDQAKTAAERKQAADLEARSVEVETERQRLRAELTAEEREEAIERERREREQASHIQEAERKQAATRQEQARLEQAERAQALAAARLAEDAEVVTRLEQEAARAEAVAAAIDPEEK